MFKHYYIIFVLLLKSIDLFAVSGSKLYVLGLFNLESQLQVDENAISQNAEEVIFVFDDSLMYENIGVDLNYLLMQNALKWFNRYDNKISALFNSGVYNYMLRNQIFSEFKIGQISNVYKLPKFDLVSDSIYLANGFIKEDSSEFLIENTGSLQFVYNDIGGFGAFSTSFLNDIALIATDTILPLRFKGISKTVYSKRRNDLIHYNLLKISDSIIYLTAKPELYKAFINERNKWYRNSVYNLNSTPEFQVSAVFPNNKGFVAQVSFAWIKDIYNSVADINNIAVTIQFDQYGSILNWVCDPLLIEQSFQYIPFIQDDFPFKFLSTLSPVNVNIEEFNPIGEFTCKSKLVKKIRIRSEAIPNLFNNTRKNVTIWHHCFRTDIVLNNNAYIHYSNYPFLFADKRVELPIQEFQFQYSLSIDKISENNVQWIFLTRDNKVVKCILDSNFKMVKYKMVNIPLIDGYNTDGHKYQYCFYTKNNLYCLDIVPTSNDINYLGYRLFKYKL